MTYQLTAHAIPTGGQRLFRQTSCFCSLLASLLGTGDQLSGGMPKLPEELGLPAALRRGTSWTFVSHQTATCVTDDAKQCKKLTCHQVVEPPAADLRYLGSVP
jgi:hypothetical protein